MAASTTSITTTTTIMLLCLALQAAVTYWSVKFYMRQAGPASPGSGLFANVRPLLIVMIALMLGNFIQIVIWATLFIFLGEFSELYGVLMFGMTSAALMAILQQLIKVQLEAGRRE